MPATAEYLAVHPFASPDIVNPPEAPTYRYRPDIETLVDFAAVETVDLSAGSRIDIIVDGALLTYVLQAGIPTGGALEIIPDDYDVSLNQQFWLLVASGNASLGVLDFTDISGTISIDQLPPGSIITVDAIGEDALYFFTDSTSLPSLLGAVGVKTFLDINFSDLSGTLALDQFPPGTVTTLDSIDEDALYFFDNDTFTPSLISSADAKTFLGLIIGTDVQAYDADLTTLAGLTATTDNFIVSVSSAWASRTPTQVRTTLALVVGTNVQAWDADLDALAGLSGTNTIYYRSASNTWTAVTISTGLDFTAGTLTATASGGSVATDAIFDAKGDLAVGTGADTAAKLTVGANDTILMADSGQSTGLKWGSPSTVRTALALVIGTNVQAWDADLDTLAGLTATTNNFIVSVASAWASRTPTQVRTTLALTIGTDVQAWDADLDTLAGLTATTDNFIVSVASAWASRTPAQVKTTLGLVIGTNVQAWDADLDTLAGLTATTDNFIVSVSSAWASRTPAQVLATLAAVGTTFQPLDSDLTTIAGLTATTDNFVVSVSSAWASRTPSQVRTTLGLVIGTNVQAWDADLDTLAGLTATTDNFVVSVSSAWASRTPSQVRTTLGLVIGTNVQAWDVDLDSWAAITRASGFDTFSTTATSANLRSLLSDELGTGAALFDGCTLTALLTTATCGASLASLNIPAGTVPTTPNDGDIFADANCFYGCTDGGNPGVFLVHHIIRADSTVTQANDANAHAIFTTPTNGRLTLETGTYRFHGVLQWTSMSGTSGNLKVDILGAGTATTGAWLWSTTGQDATTQTAVAAQSGSFQVTSATAAQLVATATGTGCGVVIDGSFEVTGVGTIIPTQTLGAAAAAVLTIGSFIEFWRIGSASMTSVGQWD